MESAVPAGPPSLGLGGPEKLVGKDDAELLPRDLAVRVAADDRAILRSGEPLIDSELSVTGRSSSAIVVYRVAHPVDQHRRSSLQVLGQQQAGPPPVTPICATRVPKASRAKTTSAPMTPL